MARYAQGALPSRFLLSVCFLTLEPNSYPRVGNSGATRGSNPVMIVEIRIWEDAADCRPRKVVVDDEEFPRALGLWTVGELVDLALAKPITVTPERPPFEVIEGGKSQRQRG
jgi:hypothetical protein